VNTDEVTSTQEHALQKDNWTA